MGTVYLRLNRGQHIGKVVSEGCLNGKVGHSERQFLCFRELNNKILIKLVRRITRGYQSWTVTHAWPFLATKWNLVRSS